MLEEKRCWRENKALSGKREKRAQATPFSLASVERDDERDERWEMRERWERDERWESEMRERREMRERWERDERESSRVHRLHSKTITLQSMYRQCHKRTASRCEAQWERVGSGLEISCAREKELEEGRSERVGGLQERDLVVAMVLLVWVWVWG
jgi:hypothetical protein